jgi:CheY-like chemotaxis protein
MQLAQEATDQKTVLLVDDEVNILAAMRRVLRREGYQILTANSGKEGLALLADHAVDVIVSDQRMPEMSGVEFLRKAKLTHPDTVRIVLSGYTELQSVTDAINEGAVYKFLTKPWDDDQIRACIAEALQYKALSDDNRCLTRAIVQANEKLAEANEKLYELLAEKQRQLMLDNASLDIAREVLHSVPLPIVGIDDDGMIVFTNAEADRVLGNATSLLGEFASEWLVPVLLEKISAPLCETFLWAHDGQRWRGLCRTMGNHSQSKGRLLILLPEGGDSAA